MLNKRLDLPPAVAKAFVRDMKAFFAEKDAIKRDLIALHQPSTLQECQGSREKKLRLDDVKEMFRQMKDQA